MKNYLYYTDYVKNRAILKQLLSRNVKQ